MEDPEAGGTWHHAPCHLASNLSAKAFSTVASTSKCAKSYSFLGLYNSASYTTFTQHGYRKSWMDIEKGNEENFEIL